MLKPGKIGCGRSESTLFHEVAHSIYRRQDMLVDWFNPDQKMNRHTMSHIEEIIVEMVAVICMERAGILQQTDMGDSISYIIGHMNKNVQRFLQKETTRLSLLYKQVETIVKKMKPEMNIKNESTPNNNNNKKKSKNSKKNKTPGV